MSRPLSSSSSFDSSLPPPQHHTDRLSSIVPELAQPRTRRSTITSIINNNKPLNNLFSSLSRNTNNITSTLPSPPATPQTPDRPDSSQMSRHRMHRSHSHSQASSPFSVTHHSSSLGQGAQVVRTPLDATMFMTQADSAAVSRQSSLRDAAPHTPQRTTYNQGATEYLTRDTSPLPSHDRASVESSLRQALEHVEQTGNTRPLRTLGRSPSAPNSQTTRRIPVDTSSGYHPTRRLLPRASASTLQKSPSRPRACPASPSSGAAASYSLLSLAESTNSPTSFKSHHRARPSNASLDTLTPPSNIVHTHPPPPLLVSRTVRPSAEAGSTVLVTLRFGFSLDAEPNTHSVTVTMDTLRPAGGTLVDFLEKAILPAFDSLCSTRSGTPSTPSGSTENMTDESSAEDSDFEYDSRMIQSLQSREQAQAPPRPPRRQYSKDSNGNVNGNSNGNGNGLPPLSDLPSALAKMKADATVQEDRTRPRASTLPPSASGVVIELVVLLQRDASAWHAIASRLCAGQWPSLDGRRRRVEEECRWAGMGGLLDELRVSVRSGGFI